MKIFIAGAKSITRLDAYVQRKLSSIYQKGFEVLVGDCYGVDASVQKYYADLNYSNVIIFSSNGKTRNNIGHWNVKNIPVPDGVRGFDFYAQKDIAMATEADYGFMIWDGESRGTLNNITNMVAQNKDVLVYLLPQKKRFVITCPDDLTSLISVCSSETKSLLVRLAAKSDIGSNSQLSILM